MLKKLIFTAIAGVIALGLVGPAMATDYELNLYGASAQFAFWNTAATDFLKTRGCLATNIHTAISSDLKNGVTVGTSCGSDSYKIR
jgi:hypothetical protein